MLGVNLDEVLPCKAIREVLDQCIQTGINHDHQSFTLIQMQM